MSWHLNPWEKTDAAGVVKALKKADELVSYYSKYSPYMAVFFADKCPERRIHENILKFAGYVDAIKTCSAWYQDVKGIYEAIDLLNRPETFNNRVLTARAFGKLLLAISVVASKFSFGGAIYGQALETFGRNFERIAEVLSDTTHGNSEYREDMKSFLGTGGNSARFINGR